MWSKNLEGSPKSRHVGLDGRRKVGVQLVENSPENNATSPTDQPKSGLLIGKDSPEKPHVEVRATAAHHVFINVAFYCNTLRKCCKAVLLI